MSYLKVTKVTFLCLGYKKVRTFFLQQRLIR